MTRIIKGDLIVQKGNNTDYSDVIKIGGSVRAYEGSKLSLPNVTSVGGWVVAYEGSKLSLPNVTSVGGWVVACEGSKLSLPNVTSVGGSVRAYEGSKLSLPNVTSVGGSVETYKGAKLSLPNCTSVGGTVVVCEGSKLSLPNVTSVGGWVETYKGAKLSLPNCTSVGGTVRASEGSKLSLPNVTSVGGSVRAYEGAKLSHNYKQYDNDAPITCAKILFESFLKQGYLFADNILAKVIEHKKNVYKIQICGQTKTSYCIEVDGVFSHGATIKKAKDSLLYKISNRDTSIYEDYTLDTVITFEDAIKMYRCITGACEGGTRHFVENVLQDKRKKYTIQEVIDLTKNQYNNKKLQEFFKVGV